MLETYVASQSSYAKSSNAVNELEKPFRQMSGRVSRTGTELNELDHEISNLPDRGGGVVLDFQKADAGKLAMGDRVVPTADTHSMKMRGDLRPPSDAEK